MPDRPTGVVVSRILPFSLYNLDPLAFPFDLEIRTVNRILVSASFIAAITFAPGAPSAVASHPVPVKKNVKKVRTGIHWTIAPSSVEIFVDGKKLGRAKDLDTTRTKPGTHTVRLVNGEDETEFDVMVKKGQIVELRYEFTDG